MPETEYLRAQFSRIDTRFDGVMSDLTDFKGRITSLEMSVAQVHGDFARQSLRLDRIELRLDRIERRLNLLPVT